MTRCHLALPPSVAIVVSVPVDPFGMASLVEIKAFMDEHKTDFVTSVKEAFASRKIELAKELRAELRDFAQ